jgi:hypothetical protein
MKNWLNNKIEKCSNKLKNCRSNSNAMIYEYFGRLTELRDTLNTGNTEITYYRYHLAKYIYKRKMQSLREGKIHSFFRGLVGFDSDTKINAAISIDTALKEEKTIYLEGNEYLASQEGNLGDINQKFFDLYKEHIACSSPYSKEDNQRIFKNYSRQF